MTTEKGLIERAKKLGMDVKDTQHLIESLEGARKQLSAALDDLTMQSTVIKQRMAWLIGELDRLQADIRGTA